MRKILLLVIVTVLTISGCSNKGTSDQEKEQTTGNPVQETSENSETKEGFTFAYQEVTIPMNVDAAPIVEKLGEPVDYFEAASCAFQGLDKIFYYSGFELGTYPNGDKDYVSYVNLLDDSVTTDKGIFLGSSLDEVVAAYGNGYKVDGTSYVYFLGDSKLTFIIEGQTVSQITYYAVVEGLNN